MQIEHLIVMANQIGIFFSSMPDHDQACADVAQHLRLFWDPRMRRTLLTAFDDPANETRQRLAPIVQQAIILHRAALTPAA